MYLYIVFQIKSYVVYICSVFLFELNVTHEIKCFLLLLL